MLTADDGTVAAIRLPALLLLTDGRFPSGGHAHSGGIEAAVGCGDVHDLFTLERFLLGRLATAGLVAAGFAAAACAAFLRTDDANDAARSLTILDAELGARMPSPALRAASRKLGRQLLRAGRAVFPHPALSALAGGPGQGLHHAVVLGAVAAAAGLDPGAAAVAGSYDSTAGPATAAVRLLGLDPFAVSGVLARLAVQVQAVAAEGARHADVTPDELPACSGPLLDIRAEYHVTWEVRLFAS